MEKDNMNMSGQPMATGGDGKVSHFIPNERWRDGLCDCCTFGCCHAMCCLGYWCQPILTGQVMTRMSRDVFGGPGLRPSVSNTCMIVTAIWIVVLIIQFSLQMVMDAEACWGGSVEINDAGQRQIRCPDGTIMDPSGAYQAVSAVSGVIGFAFFLYIFIALCRTRNAMRRKYNIPTGACGGCEDCCCSFCCSCCTVQQMARHTNDYSTYSVPCCSNDCFNKRGQQDHLPEIDC